MKAKTNKSYHLKYNTNIYIIYNTVSSKEEEVDQKVILWILQALVAVFVVVDLE